MRLTRRDTLATVMAAATSLAARRAMAASAGPALGLPRPFSFDRLKAMAKARAARPYVAPPAPSPALARAIGDGGFGQIAYRPEAALWRDAPGGPNGDEVRFFHLARPAPTPVSMAVVAQGQARPVLYSEALFDLPASSPAARLGAGGFGGFRVMNPGGQGDWLAFLGASYFRAAAPFNQYGLSARGLALDTATGRPEEFPAFTAFWLEHAPGADLVVYALLESPSVAGASRIGCQRSPQGLVQDISAELTFRRAVGRLGLAPLTSMYWYGQGDRAAAADWRPQVHDSDGLSIWTGAGERIWRPLENPPRVTTNAFSDKAPRGFGLMQRDRRFEDYQDDGVFYDRRPSAWVEPVGDWGPGSVQLVEIPTREDSDDNIVAFWTPAAPVVAGQSLAYRYRLHWAAEEPQGVGVARVVATRTGQGGQPDGSAAAGRRKIVVDFEGGGLSGLDRASRLQPVVEARPGQVIDPVCYPVAGADRWRLMFDVAAPDGAVIDLRAFLRRGGQALTETWIHQVFAT